ncbi:ribosomal protein L5 domain-containing protein [Hysterangium stoloniferum]|nr:ribosomal protein L5 domain-containing protein [Hysterangium stoloniferum]
MPGPRRIRWLDGKPRTTLPSPHVPILLRSMYPSRLSDHYYDTLRDDVMYMTYNHEFRPRAPAREPNMKYDPEDPYSKHRRNIPRGGLQIGKKPAPPTTPHNVIRLEKIALHCMVKEATSNRAQLLPAIMALRVLSGETHQGGGLRKREGVQIVKGRKTEGGWIRPGLPCGARVEMTGDRMYEFLDSLVNFVLPRLREFNGITMPYASRSQQTPSGVSGVVSFGLPPQALGFFPEVEVNVDSYPRLHGFHIHFITNAFGRGAQSQARTLLSGFRIPFARAS